MSKIALQSGKIELTDLPDLSQQNLDRRDVVQSENFENLSCLFCQVNPYRFLVKIHSGSPHLFERK